MCPPTPVKDKVVKKTGRDKNQSGDPSHRRLSQSYRDFYPSASLLSSTPVSEGRSNSGWHLAPPPPLSSPLGVASPRSLCVLGVRFSVSLWPSTLHLLQSSADRHLSVSCFGHISYPSWLMETARNCCRRSRLVGGRGTLTLEWGRC